MNHKKGLGGVDVLVLCGGQGTRLQPVLPGRPKVLAAIADRPFLDILLESFSSQGFTRTILGVGHLKEQIKDEYRGLPNIFFSEENAPLGTGGAVKNAAGLIKSGDFLVVNGDSMFKGLDLGKFHEFHAGHGGLVSIALAAPRTEKDFGSVVLAKDNLITAFAEKSGANGGGLMNSGVYLMKREAIGRMPDGAFSLEYDFFPRLTGGSLYGFFSEGEVLDIGTPERYERAKTILS